MSSGSENRCPTVWGPLHVLRDLMLGGRHSRRTVARSGVSLPTADRWLAALMVVPGVKRVRVGKTSWFEWEPLRRGLGAKA